MSDQIWLDNWFQGPTGSGQGGWTAHQLAGRIDHPVTMAIKAPVPLETPLDVVLDAATERWLLVDHGGAHAVTVMVAEPWETTCAETEPVTIEEAAEARSRFGAIADPHPVPFCFSCGLQHDSMRVHAGPLDDDRFATDWTPPSWSVGDDGSVDTGPLWAALDCTAAWYVSYSREHRSPLTVQYAVEVLEPIQPDMTYALVGWSGDHSSEWDGRKRHGASAAFAPDGTCIARSASFWLSVDR